MPPNPAPPHTTPSQLAPAPPEHALIKSASREPASCLGQRCPSWHRCLRQRRAWSQPAPHPPSLHPLRRRRLKRLVPPEAGSLGPPDAKAEPKHRSACGVWRRDWQEGVWGWGAKAWAGWPKSFQFFLSAQWRDQVSQLGSHIARRSVLETASFRSWVVAHRRESRGGKHWMCARLVRFKLCEQKSRKSER